jgi:hypothetical protein
VALAAEVVKPFFFGIPKSPSRTIHRTLQTRGAAHQPMPDKSEWERCAKLAGSFSLGFVKKVIGNGLEQD